MTVPVRLLESEDEALRAVRWLRRARVPAEIGESDDAFVVLVAPEHAAEAEFILNRRAAGPAPIPDGAPGLGERIFNMENVLLVVFVVGGLFLVGIALVSAFMVAIRLGAVVAIALVIAGLAYFHFSGTHSAVGKPGRLRLRTGPLAQDAEVRHNYRRAWIKDVYSLGRKPEGDGDDDDV